MLISQFWIYDISIAWYHRHVISYMISDAKSYMISFNRNYDITVLNLSDMILTMMSSMISYNNHIQPPSPSPLVMSDGKSHGNQMISLWVFPVAQASLAEARSGALQWRGVEAVLRVVLIEMEQVLIEMRHRKGIITIKSKVDSVSLSCPELCYERWTSNRRSQLVLRTASNDMRCVMTCVLVHTS